MALHLAEGKIGMGNRLFYVFRVQSQKELGIARFLRTRGLDAIVPLQFKTRRAVSSGSGKREPHRAPAVPGYVFIALSGDNPELHEVFRFRAIKSVVGFNGTPAGIKSEVMESWMRRLAYKPKEEKRIKYNKGDRVTLKTGVFAGFPAVVENVLGNQASVLVYLFGRPTEVKVSVEHLVAPGAQVDAVIRPAREIRSRQSQLA